MKAEKHSRGKHSTGKRRINMAPAAGRGAPPPGHTHKVLSYLSRPLLNLSKVFLPGEK